MGKVCKKCQRCLPVTDFYVHSAMTDGHLSFCKECVKTRLRDQRRNDPRVLARTRARAHFNPEAMRKYRTPEAVRAHSAVDRAIRRGELVRPLVCEECGDDSRMIEAAHGDYSKTLQVRWLCRRCHCRWDVVQSKTAALRPSEPF